MADRLENKNQLKCAINNFHKDLEKPGTELDIAKKKA